MTRLYSLMAVACLCVGLGHAARAVPGDELFSPSLGNMLGGASAFAAAFYNYSAAAECNADPSCGMPDDPGSGFQVGAGSCCDENDECFNEFGRHVDRIDRALLKFYTREREYNLIMRVQSARMTAMKGAGSMSAPAAAIVARQEIEIAKAQKGYIERFNNNTNINLGHLNNFLLELGTVVDNYCEGTNWYQRNGMPLYLHAKIKFPK